MAAIAGLYQFLAGLFLAEPFVELEILHRPLHELLGRLPQRHLLAARQPLALALADLFALDRDRFHALGQRVRGQQRHREGEHRRDRGDAGEDHRDQPGVVQDGDDGLDHVESCWFVPVSQKSKLIIFFMTMQPMNIHVALPSSINCPVGWVQSSSI